MIGDQTPRGKGRGLKCAVIDQQFCFRQVCSSIEYCPRPKPPFLLNLWREPVDKHFDVPKGYELVCGISLGYPSDAEVNSYRPEKLSIEELLVPKK